MSQSTAIVGFLAAAFLLYLAANGRLLNYTAVLWGPAPKPSGGGGGGSGGGSGGLGSLTGGSGGGSSGGSNGIDMQTALQIGEMLLA